jgi:hypothetical protein
MPLPISRSPRDWPRHEGALSLVPPTDQPLALVVADEAPATGQLD